MSSPVSVPARSEPYRYNPAAKKPKTVRTFNLAHTTQLTLMRQGLLKDKLQLVRADSTGSTSPRYTIKKLPDQLPFDKVHTWCLPQPPPHRCNAGLVRLGAGYPATYAQE